MVFDCSPVIGSSRSQYFRQVERADGQARAIDHTLELHQAARIKGDYRACFCFENRIDLGARHSTGNLWELDGEGAPESTAFLGRFHFAQRKALDLGKQPSRAILDVQFTQRVAAIVVSDHPVEPRADILHARHLQQESPVLSRASAAFAMVRA